MSNPVFWENKKNAINLSSAGFVKDKISEHYILFWGVSVKAKSVCVLIFYVTILNVFTLNIWTVQFFNISLLFD